MKGINILFWAFLIIGVIYIAISLPPRLDHPYFAVGVLMVAFCSYALIQDWREK